MEQKPKRLAPPTAWKPGQSGNPKGRPRTGLALAERIRETVDLDEIIQIALEIARGDATTTMVDKNGQEYEVGPPAAARIAALNFLATNGYIKPPTTIAIDAPTSPVDFSRLNAEQLEAFERLLTEATAEREVIDVPQEDE